MSGLAKRAIGAALLDRSVYEDVESDPRSIRQALLVVLAASVAGGLGSGWPKARDVILAALLTLLGWLVWAGLTYWIGTRLLPEPQTRSSLGELLRTIGFANAPGVLRALGVIPALRGIVLPVTGIWVLAATIVAVRQALDYKGTMRAVWVCGIGWLIQIGLLAMAFTYLAITSGPAY